MHGRYLYASEAGARTVGLTAAEMIGRSWQELGMPAAIMEPFHQEVAAVFAGEPSIRRQVS